MDLQKEACKGSRPFPEIPCIQCGKPLDLRIDLSAGDNGQAVHKECYVNRITSSLSNPAAGCNCRLISTAGRLGKGGNEPFC